MRIDRMESVSRSVSGGASGCQAIIVSGTHLVCVVLRSRTLDNCASSLGASFSHALDAILPSGGSSEVIVFSAVKDVR